MHEPIISIPAGNSVALTVTWSDLTGLPEVPTAVQYQVFDERTGARLSPINGVPELGSTMSFSIAPEHLPVGSAQRRNLVVQIRGSFNTDVHTEQVVVQVHKQFAFG